jgi:PilZ domain
MGLVTSAYRKVTPARIEQRQIARHPVFVKRAKVRGHGRQPVEAELVDLSIYGCRLSVDAPFKAEDRVWLRFADDKSISATAVWFEGDFLGCRFDEPLDHTLFRSLTLVLC